MPSSTTAPAARAAELLAAVQADDAQPHPALGGPADQAPGPVGLVLLEHEQRRAAAGQQATEGGAGKRGSGHQPAIYIVY